MAPGHPPLERSMNFFPALLSKLVNFVKAPSAETRDAARTQAEVAQSTPTAATSSPGLPDWTGIVATARHRLEQGASPDLPTYPVRALGPLADAAAAISREAQVQIAIVGQAVLAAASMLCVAQFRVQTLTGPKPLSLYLLTEAASGDGKTTAENAALRPVLGWEKAKPDDRLIQRDATVAATLNRLSRAKHGVVGFMTSEAGSFFGGHSFNGASRISTGATLNSNWDHGELSYARVTQGVDVHMYDRFLVMSLAGQPLVTAGIVRDKSLAGLGFLPRLLYAIPHATEPRIPHMFNADHPALVAHWKRTTELMEQLSAGVEVTLLVLDEEAVKKVGSKLTYYENEARKGSLQHIQPFALRATEQICRVAGVMAAWDRRTAVTGADIDRAGELVEYSLRCWTRALTKADDEVVRGAAIAIVEYMADKSKGNGVIKGAMNLGPAPREAKPRRAALELLIELGIIRPRGDDFEFATVS